MGITTPAGGSRGTIGPQGDAHVTTYDVYLYSFISLDLRSEKSKIHLLSLMKREQMENAIGADMPRVEAKITDGMI